MVTWDLVPKFLMFNFLIWPPRAPAWSHQASRARRHLARVGRRTPGWQRKVPSPHTRLRGWKFLRAQVIPAPSPRSPLLHSFVDPKPLAQAWHQITCLIKCSLMVLATVVSTTATISTFRGNAAQEWGDRELTTALEALLSVPPNLAKDVWGQREGPLRTGAGERVLAFMAVLESRGKKSATLVLPVFKLSIFCSSWIFASILKNMDLRHYLTFFGTSLSFVPKESVSLTSP